MPAILFALFVGLVIISWGLHAVVYRKVVVNERKSLVGFPAQLIGFALISTGVIGICVVYLVWTKN